MFPPDSPTLMISALQHYQFCPRQFALIHLEQQWAENQLTVKGQILHERVDRGGTGTRNQVKQIRSMPLYSQIFQLRGIADLVEVKREKNTNATAIENLYPVETKKGKPKKDLSDSVQLCAQALCLEEMFQIDINEAYFYYAQTRARHSVLLDEPLRARTKEVINACHLILAKGERPSVPEKANCKKCSLLDLCLPEVESNSKELKEVDFSDEEDL